MVLHLIIHGGKNFLYDIRKLFSAGLPFLTGICFRSQTI